MSLMPRPTSIKQPLPSLKEYTSAWEVIYQAWSHKVGQLMPFTQWNAEFVIQLPVDGAVRIRSPKKVAHNRIIWLFPSHKNNRWIECESSIERKMAHILEANIYVESFTEQPFIMYWKDELGVKRHHIPDFEVQLKNGDRLIIEVKPNSALKDPLIIERTKLLNRLCSSHGQVRYLLIIESQLIGVELSNSEQINRYEFVGIDELEVEELRNLICKVGCNTLEMLRSNITEVRIENIEIKIKNLIRYSLIKFDMTELFGLHTKLYWNEEYKK